MEKIRICDACLLIRRIHGVFHKGHKGKKRQFRSSGRDSDGLICVLRGSVRCEFDDGSAVTAKQGDILYLAYRARYTVFISGDDYTITYCNFEFDSEAPRRSEVFTPQNFEYFKGLFKRLYKLPLHHSPEELACGFALLYEIYAGVMELAAERREGEPLLRMRAAEEYIHSHLDSPQLSVSSLAETCEVSEVYLRRLFRNAYGKSPSEYIRQARLRRARELMRDSFLSLEEIALQSGFFSLPYFCRVFKADTGETPAQFRKKEYGI